MQTHFKLNNALWQKQYPLYVHKRTPHNADAMDENKAKRWHQAYSLFLNNKIMKHFMNACAFMYPRTTLFYYRTFAIFAISPCVCLSLKTAANFILSSHFKNQLTFWCAQLESPQCMKIRRLWYFIAKNQSELIVLWVGIFVRHIVLANYKGPLSVHTVHIVIHSSPQFFSFVNAIEWTTNLKK